MTGLDQADYDFLLASARAGKVQNLSYLVHLDQPIGIWNYIRIANDIARQAPPGDEQSLAATVVELLSERERRQRLGDAGRTRVERHFTAAQMARTVETVYSHLLGLGGSA